MREKLKDKDRLNHILESIDNIFEFIKNHLKNIKKIKFYSLQLLRTLK